MARPPDTAGDFERLTKRGRVSTSITQRVRDAVVKGRGVAKRTVDRARGGAGGTNSSRTKQATSTETVVTVEYTPALDGDPDPGDVVWAWVPYEEDPTQGKDRPVVVIGRRGEALVGVPLTTKQNDDEAQVEVGTGDWDPKRRVSYARIWRMLDVDPSAMRREGAVLPRDRFDRIISAVDRYYEVRRAEAPTTNASRGRSGADQDDH